jgi:single-strand DNA-binding protein
MAQIIGIFRIGRDAELRYTQGGEPVASLALAYNYGQKGQDGNKPSQWIEASMWGKRAEAMAQYLKKGGQIYAVISDPHIETYEKRGGGEGFKLVGKVSEIEFAGGSRGAGDGQSGGKQQDSGYQPAPQRQGGGGASSKPRPTFDDLGDDIPFASCAIEDDVIGRKLGRRIRRAA